MSISTTLSSMCQYKTQAGFSLLEVLIAWAAFTLIALSVASYQITSLRRTQQALWQSIALAQGQNLLESLRVMRTEDLRQAELYRWNQITKRSLPQGRAQYQCGATQCAVIIFWQQQSQEQRLQLIGALQ